MFKALCLILVVFLSGCASNGVKLGTADISASRNSKSHVIPLEIDESLKGQKAILNDIDFYNISEGDKRYILVVGAVQKVPGGISIDRKKIDIKFFDAAGNILSEKEDKVSLSYLRGVRGSKGRFSVKLPYDAAIVKCAIAWAD